MTRTVSDGSLQDALMASGTPIPGTDASTFRSSSGALMEALPVEGVGGGGGEGGPVEWDNVLNKPSTFPPIVGTTSSTAKAGDYAPAWGDVTDKPAVMAVGATQQEARDAIGALNAALLGQPGGVAQLDPTGSVPLDQINVSSLTFKGAWYPTTNTPTLLNGTGSVGDFYKAAESGSFNFGNGSFDFVEGDWVMFAAGVWQRLGSKETVSSVNGKMGVIELTAEDIGALPDTYTPPVYTPPPYQAIHVQEQKAAGTNGGSNTAGTWLTRALSSVRTNTIAGASLASNAITLPAGTYKVTATGCTYFAGSNRMRVTANSVAVLQGMSCWSSNNQLNNFATLTGVFTIASTQVIRLEHRVSYAHATGWGNAANYDGQPEVFAEIFIEKVG